ncbi:arsenate reductase family protein [Stomatobaculum longum]|uniref:arsenate reductase family protein n=1 Tax=Stomatobaculum longum TaxID=796942 RepID=UPI0028E92EDD|nr:ArsC/Spx/MgsR family protein [Stomatobaculum longum]
MNIQIFGGGKNFDVKKAERYFKERRIPVQRVDLFEKGLSKGELRAVCLALGSAEALVDTGAKAKETVIWFQHTAEEDREAFLLEHPEIMRQPIVRNGAQVTVGYQPEVWKNWA